MYANVRNYVRLFSNTPDFFELKQGEPLTLYLPMIHWSNKCYPIHLSTYWCPLVYMQR